MQGVIEHTYEIESQLGSGGCGTVYKAWHKRLQKHLVLKKLKNNARKSAVEQRNEIEALKNVKSMYIPQVFDFLAEEGSSYTVMEYIDGVSFDKLLADGEAFPSQHVARWYYQLSVALETLHGSNICHRDIKPGNIIRTQKGDACLIDFNNALVGGCKTGIVGRSISYASPEQYEYFQICERARSEQLRDDESKARYKECKKRLLSMNIDWKLSDIYSLGAAMYHILTGKRPHIDTFSQTGLKKYNQEILEIIKRSMMRSPAERYASAHELRRELERLFNFSD